MAFFDLFDMTVAYVQYLYILLSISPLSFPDFYVEPFRSLRYVTLEFLDSFGEANRYNNPLEITLPMWIPLDARLQFAINSVIAPFIVSLVGILVVCATRTFGWITLTLTALFCMMFGAILVAKPTMYAAGDISRKTRVLLLSIGTVLSFLFISIGIIIFFIFRIRKRKSVEAMIADSASDIETRNRGISLAEKAVTRSAMNRRALAALYTYEDGKEKYIRRCRLRILIPQFLIALATLAGGMVLVGFPKIMSLRFLQLSPLGRGVGGLLIIAAFLTFFWVILGLFKRGRRWQVTMYDWLASPILGFIMIAISLIYSPVLLNIISILWCTELECKAGERMSNPGSLVHAGSNLSIWDPPINPCLPCDFSMYNQNCPKNLQEQLCGFAVRQSRLAYDESVPCQEINTFFKVSIAVIILAYTISYPIFLVVIADRATKILEKEYPLEKRICDEFTEKELYYEKVQKSRNVSAPVYKVFKRRYRKARLTFLLQRVLLVTISSLTRRGLPDKISWLGLGLVLIVCTLYFAYTTILRPYARHVENIYSATQQIVIAAIASIGIVGSVRGREVIPFAVAVIFAVIVFVAPLLALIIGFIRTFREERQRAERLKRRLQSGFAVIKKDSKSESRRGSRSGSVTSGDNNNNNNNNKRRESRGAKFLSSIEEQESNNNNNNNNNNRKREPRGAKFLSSTEEEQEVNNNNNNKRREPRGAKFLLSTEEEQGANNNINNSLISPPSNNLLPKNTQPSILRRHSSMYISPPALPLGSSEILTYPKFDERDRELLVASPSEPTTEKEPLDLEAQISGRDGGLILSHATSSTTNKLVNYHDDNNNNNRVGEFQEDDYFNDRREFIPAEFFRDYTGVPIVIYEGNEEEQQKQSIEEEEEKTGFDNTVRGFLSKLAAAATFRPKRRESTSHGGNRGFNERSSLNIQERSQRNSIEMILQQQQKRGGAEEQLHHCGECETGGCVAGNNNNNNSEGKGIIGILRRWQNAIIGENSLRYNDILEKRRELNKVTGIRDRPFWLDPSEMQLQAYNIPGSSIPWYCASNNRIQATNQGTYGQKTMFAKIRERKNQYFSPIVIPSRTQPIISKSERDDVSSIPNMLSSSASLWYNDYALNGIGLEEDHNPSSEIKSYTGSNIPHPDVEKKTKTNNKQEQNEKKKSLFDRNEQYSPVLQSPASNVPLPTMRNNCVISAQWKIDKLTKQTQRTLKRNVKGRRRSTAFAPIIPKVHMEGMEVTDWDSFLHKLLIDVSDPVPGETTTTKRKIKEKEKEEEGNGSLDSTSIRTAPQEEYENVQNSQRESNDSLNLPLQQQQPREESQQSSEQKEKQEKKIELTEQMSQLRRHFILRQRLRLAFQQQSDRLRALQQAVDHRIAITIKKYMQFFFIALGFFTILALVMCLSGMLETVTESFVDGVRHENTLEHELLGYHNWSEFTSKCCCVSIINLTATFPYYVFDVEDWLCENGRVKERVRRDAFNSEMVSGYNVRDLCGMNFKNGCELVILTDNTNNNNNINKNSKLELRGCSSEVTEAEQRRW